MFREIHTSEKIEKINDKQEQAFLNIKPESDMSFDDCMDFWAEEFRRVAAEAED